MRQRDVVRTLRAADVAVVRRDDGLFVGYARTDESVRLAAQLPQLTELCCPHAASDANLFISDAGLVHLRGHPSLRRVDISHQAVTGAGLAVLPTLPLLEEFHFNLREQVDEGLAHIGRCERLRVLALEDSATTDECLKSLAGLRGLEKLRLNNAPIHGDLRVMPCLVTLRELSLEGTKIGDEALENIAQLPSLEKLFVGRTRVSNDGLRQIPRLASLRTLSVSGEADRITTLGMSSIKTLRHLETLFLSGIEIDGELVESLSGISTLRSLFVDADRAPPAIRVALGHRLPNCDILYLEGEAESEPDIRE